MRQTKARLGGRRRQRHIVHEVAQALGALGRSSPAPAAGARISAADLRAGVRVRNSLPAAGALSIGTASALPARRGVAGRWRPRTPAVAHRVQSCSVMRACRACVTCRAHRVMCVSCTAGCARGLASVLSHPCGSVVALLCRSGALICGLRFVRSHCASGRPRSAPAALRRPRPIWPPRPACRGSCSLAGGVGLYPSSPPPRQRCGCWCKAPRLSCGGLGGHARP